MGAALALFLLALLTTGCGGSKPVIRFHVWEGTGSHWLNNAIAGFIIEKGYGYPVEVVVETTPVLLEALPKGEVDLNLEGWQQNIPDWYNEQIEKGNIVNLGMTFEGGPQFFMIPRWVAEEYNIKTVFDMDNHWELFQDPQDPSKGVFYNCTIGTQCAEINRVKLEAYGLTRYYNLVSPGSEDAREAALARPQERHQPVFGYYWAPTALMGAFDWHILEEPPYTDECWEKVTAASNDKSLRPIDQACAYENRPIDKLAHKGLLKKAPDVVEMLRNMMVGQEPISRTLAWANENGVEDWEKMAIYYMQTYQDRWETWVAPEPYEKIKKALEEASG
ncbi:MAG: glycine betaine ABC transporter substrate-binding protein [Dehalococcoidia bacterium]